MTMNYQTIFHFSPFRADVEVLPEHVQLTKFSNLHCILCKSTSHSCVEETVTSNGFEKGKYLKQRFQFFFRRPHDKLCILQRRGRGKGCHFSVLSVLESRKIHFIVKISKKLNIFQILRRNNLESRISGNDWKFRIP